MIESLDGADDWLPWIDRCTPLARVTSAALEEALGGFPLKPKQGVDWLARAIQGALLFTFPTLREQRHPDTGECCVITIPNATEAKKIYNSLSDAASDLLVQIIRNADLISIDHRSDICKKAEEIAEFFADVAASAEPSKKKWRAAREREERIQMACALSPVFEEAFSRKPAVSNRTDGGAGPWPDFFQRIMALVLGEKKTPDLHGVLKAARRIDLLGRVKFAPGQIPE